MTHHGSPLVFGVPEITLRVESQFEGRIKLRFRECEFAKAYVRTPSGIREFALATENGCWTLGPEIGRNLRVTMHGAGADALD